MPKLGTYLYIKTVIKCHVETWASELELRYLELDPTGNHFCKNAEV